jgi:DNA-directed RNA polymerase specialized sigma24 family protein
MFAKKTDFWAKAYQQNAPKLLALCRRYVSDASKAEDLMHDAFVTEKGILKVGLRKLH